jgi:hypothetical protein
VQKTIAEWIHRRRDLATMQSSAWKALTDRNLKEGWMRESTGTERKISLVRCYDPEERDRMIDLYDSEPMAIDSRLEVVNAITDLME